MPNTIQLKTLFECCTQCHWPKPPTKLFNKYIEGSRCMMQQQRGTLETIALLLARFLHPLEERLAAGNVRVLFAELGLQFPPALETVPGFTAAAQTTVVAAQQLPM